jgi:thioredoxin reductase/NAD-dependent dihydropyrimidine dehydrogenase PreA subunit
MPAWKVELQEAEEEGVKIDVLCTPVKFSGEKGTVTKAELIRMKLGEPDESGRRRPVEVPGSNYTEEVDFVIEAIGLNPTTSVFKGELDLDKSGRIQADPTTLQTSHPWAFAGGDSVTGSSTIIEAIGHGKRAAFYMDKFLSGLDPKEYQFGDKLPAIDKKQVLSRENILHLPALDPNLRLVSERVKDFQDIEKTFTEEQVKKSTLRCLDCSNCRECHQCITACPANAIDFSQREEKIETQAKSVIVSSGFNLFNAEAKPHFGFGKLPNVIDSLQMDRLIAPTRPFNNVLRPGDGKMPGNIAYVLCAGSRDSSLENYRSCSVASSNNPICSQICCMYSIKQAQLLMGALPMADITIYYIDIRSFGKGYEEFYQQSKSMGINFVKGKVARIRENKDKPGDLILRFENIETGVVKEVSHDLVVLSVGVQSSPEIAQVFKNVPLELDDYRFIKQTDVLTRPSVTSIEGVFVAGTAAGPMDIPDSIMSAGCAASEAAAYLCSSTVVETK